MKRVLFWTAFGLTSPGSFFDFVPGLLVMPGALLALVSSVATIVPQRRGHLTTGAEVGERRGIRIAVSVVLVLLYCRPHTVGPDAPEEDDMAAELQVT